MSAITALTESHGEYLRLHWSKDGETVTVTPNNEDRFAIKRRKLVDILELAAKSEQFEEQLNFLMKVLAVWLSKQDGVESAYLTFGEGALSFIAVRRDVKYDATFDDALASLDYDIANDADLDLVRLNTLSLPPVEGSALRQFLNSDFTLVYAGGQ